MRNGHAARGDSDVTMGERCSLKRQLAGAAMAVGIGLAVVAGGFVATGGRVFVYSGENAGIVLTAPYGCLGLEVRGIPGFFGGADPGECDI